MPRQWLIPRIEADEENRLARELAVSPLLARVLISRGISSPEAGRSFLSSSLTDLPSPFLFKDMERAVQRLTATIERKACPESRRERVVIFGDYDVDGVTSIALLLHFLGALGVPASYYVPHRLEEGYGLNAKAVEGLKGLADLIITVDCGVTNYEEVALAKKLGMDVIVVDHHETRGKLPEALAILNPKQADCPFPEKELAAVGVCFNLAMALRARLRELGISAADQVPNLKRLLYLVALGTIGDVAPLTGLNRVLVKYGLAELSNTPSPGIMALKEVSGIKEGSIESGTVAFALAPRLNAPGRVQDASLAVELLICPELPRARALAQTLNGYNQARQKLVEETFSQAREMARVSIEEEGRKVLVLASPDWHQGVVGIVASRLVEEFHRPAIVLTQDKGSKYWKGSARSIPAFPIHKVLEECADLLTKYGGHKAAAGLTIEEGNLRTFSERLDSLGRAMLTAEGMSPMLRVDCLATFAELSQDSVQELSSLKPFGMGNPEPVLASLGAEVLASRLIGIGEGHLKLTLRQGDSVLEGIGFNLAVRYSPFAIGQQQIANSKKLIANSKKVNLAYSPEINEWAGQRRVRLKLKALQTECSR